MVHGTGGLYPTEYPVRLEFAAGGPREVSMGEDTVVVVPLLIRYTGVANAYCKFVAVNGSTRKPILVSVPVEADFDHCRKMQKIAEIDLNDDGLPDFAFSVEVPSNRYPVNVSEGMVYLSDWKRGTYCFARGLSPLAIGFGGTPRAFKALAWISTAPN